MSRKGMFFPCTKLRLLLVLFGYTDDSFIFSGFLDPRKFKRRGGTTPGGAGSSKKK